MEDMLQWQLHWIKSIQAWPLSGVFAWFFRIITELGSAWVFFMLIPFIYWCIDEKKGLRLGIVMIISLWINLAMKQLFDQPRPFFPNYDASVNIFGLNEKMGGFPSGHAQNSLVMWCIIASWGRKKWLCGSIAAIVCLLISFSRVFMGVHFPTDIIGAWLIGGIIVCVYFLAGKKIESLLSAHSTRVGMYACAVLAFAMIQYRPVPELLVPSGLLIGLGFGRHLCRLTGFSVETVGKTGIVKIFILAARFAVGMGGLVLLYFFSKDMILDMVGNSNFQLIVFIYSLLMAVLIFAGLPGLFCLLRLAGKNAGSENE